MTSRTIWKVSRRVTARPLLPGRKTQVKFALSRTLPGLLKTSVASVLGLVLSSGNICLLSPNAYCQTSPAPYRIPVTVRESDGRPVYDIKPEQLRLKGVDGRVRNVRFSSRPRRIVLLLDASGSMSGNDRSDPDRWKNAVSITKEFIAALQKGDRVALHLFADMHTVLVSTTEDFTSVSHQLDTLPKPETKILKQSYGDNTRVGDALTASLAAERELALGDAVVLISDGEWAGEGKVSKLGKLAPDFVTRGVRLFLLCVELPHFDEFTPPNAFAKTVAQLRESGDVLTFVSDELLNLVRMTGGEMFNLWDPFLVRPGTRPLHLTPGLARATAEAAYRMVRDAYEVEIELDHGLARPHKIELRLVDEHGKKLPSLRLNYPHVLEPPVHTIGP